MSFKERCRWMLVGALSLMALQTLALIAYTNGENHRLAACNRAAVESAVFDACINSGVCLFGPADLQKSADNLSLLEDCE
jgi:hypothetical protein